MQDGPMLKFETWAPDLSAIDTNVTVVLSNVLPRADGYGPVPSLAFLSQSLPSPCRGGIFARDPVDASVIVFAATATDLWRMDNTTFAWRCISKQVSHGAIPTGTSSGVIAGGSAYTDGTYSNVSLLGGTHGGGGAIATITVVGGIVTTVNITNGGSGYQTSDVLIVPAGAIGLGGGGFNFTLSSWAGGGAPPSPGLAALNEYAPVPPTDNWQFAQFNNLILAAQANAPPQKFVLRASTYFSDVSGAPPQASHIAIINQFVVLSGVLGFPFRVQWSDFGNPEVWNIPGTLANQQDMPDGGGVHDIRGSDQYGIIFQDASVRMMSLAFGSQFVFSILRISQLDGLFGQYSSITAGDKVFFCSPQGFKKIEAGGAITPIGKEKVDRTFFADVDQSNLQLFVAATDPKATRVYWQYKSQGGAVGLADKVLVYDWVLDKFTPIVGQMLEYLFYLTKPGLTLEGIDTIAPGVITITAAANNGSGGWRLTLSPGVTNLPYDLTTQFRVEINNATGGLLDLMADPWDGNFQFTIIDPLHIDLVNTAGVTAIPPFSSTGTGTLGGSLDAMTVTLDSFVPQPLPQLAAFGSTVNGGHMLGLFTGPNMQAIVETPDQDLGERMALFWLRPMTDAPTCFGSIGTRDTAQSAVLYTTEQAITPQGLIPQRCETRYARGHLRVPSGVAWTYASGMKSPDAVTGQGDR
jgi:hypothetical protein